MPLSTEGQHTTGGVTVAQPKKLEAHPLCQEYETGTKQPHKTINNTVCGTPSCVAADKKAHFSKRWAELRISRERQWLTALLCFPLYWLWVKIVDVDLPPLPILINLQQETGRIPCAPQMRNCYSAEQKYFIGCNLSCGVYAHCSWRYTAPLYLHRYSYFDANGTHAERNYFSSKTFRLDELHCTL